MDDQVTRSVDLDASVEDVWQAVADPAERAEWLDDEDARSRHVRVDESAPGERLVWTWWRRATRATPPPCRSSWPRSTAAAPAWWSPRAWPLCRRPRVESRHERTPVALSAARARTAGAVGRPAGRARGGVRGRQAPRGVAGRPAGTRSVPGPVTAPGRSPCHRLRCGASPAPAGPMSRSAEPPDASSPPWPTPPAARCCGPWPSRAPSPPRPWPATCRSAARRWPSTSACLREAGLVTAERSGRDAVRGPHRAARRPGGLGHRGRTPLGRPPGEAGRAIWRRIRRHLGAYGRAKSR